MSLDIAVNNLQRFGNYPTAMTFASNDKVDDPEVTDLKFSAAFDPTEHVKRHAACDECRMCIEKRRLYN